MVVPGDTAFQSRDDVMICGFMLTGSDHELRSGKCGKHDLNMCSAVSAALPELKMWHFQCVLRSAGRKMASEPHDTLHQSHGSSSAVSRYVGGVRGPDSLLLCVRD